LLKAKFHYASWFGASSELASVMEFGFYTVSFHGLVLEVCRIIWLGLCRHLVSEYYYRVAQNKPDYLLLSSKFCISTTKHASTIMYV